MFPVYSKMNTYIYAGLGDHLLAIHVTFFATLFKSSLWC